MTVLLQNVKVSIRVRKSLVALAVAMTAALSNMAMSHAATIDEVKSRGYLLVATEDDYRPFEFMDEGKATGYDNELLALVEKKIGLKIRQQILPWAGILPGVTTGKYDMALSAVLVTKARKATFDFTSPTAQSTTYFATKKGSSILKPEDLAGKTVGAETGSAMLTDLKDFDTQLKAKGKGLKEIVEYHGYPEAYQDLANDRLDAVANTDLSLLSLVKERGDMFVMGQPIGEPTYLAWAVAKGNTGVLQMVDAALLDLRKSGEMYRLQKKWLGESHEDMPTNVN
ncbi:MULTISPECIES: transporter substrate-binding domain-containing protein [unclassified Pseudomonas]|uniref:transporter substrate-binding domain-containing protein n=1 Tax=unclassified Pseudomonas TaxID=196821 RepID=UPI000D3A5BC0|nr:MULTISPECIES: transporter substrate-binding domain-containing protein [unclassified Pseudomonas]RAU47889.1 ABC transporter substrate-binding protein [Pseudomonas sp. RIT 409]RAU55417.1 ABC transporter substrate-binding protein [Pseudomonas sp. RIT 412]